VAGRRSASTIARSKSSGAYRERCVVQNGPARNTPGHRQAHTIFGRHAFEYQLLAVGESETSVVGGITDQHASLSA
jgi:hypothetical protein